jgi:cytoskeleton protein RodZ
MPYYCSSLRVKLPPSSVARRRLVLPSFGENLKLEREKRNISLEEISASTKIGTRMLQALEEEKFNQLPGGIFNKGFVRAYARMVGLDEDQAVAEYLQASGEALPVGPDASGRDNSRENTVRENEERISRLEAISDTPSRPLPWGVFAVILLAVALALSLWSHRHREQERIAAHAPARSAPESAPAPSSPDTTAVPPNTAAAQSSPVSAAPNSEPIPAKSPGEQPSATSTQSSPAKAETNATPAPGEFTILVRTREESWMSSVVDGRPTPSATLPPHSERTFHGRKEVVIKVGNAAGVDFLLNGKKLEVGGDEGQVKTVTIGPTGLLPNALASPPSP